MVDVIELPDSVNFTEDLAVYLQGPGNGRTVDLGGRHVRPRGGYKKEYGYSWHEHPRAHWHLPFLSAGTGIKNGTVSLSPRVMLINEGPGMRVTDVQVLGA